MHKSIGESRLLHRTILIPTMKHLKFFGARQTASRSSASWVKAANWAPQKSCNITQLRLIDFCRVARKREAWRHAARGRPYIMSAKFSGFWTPSPPCPHLGRIYSTKFTQPPLLQWSAVRVTPSGIGKSVTVTDCHSNSSFPRALK